MWMRLVIGEGCYRRSFFVSFDLKKKIALENIAVGLRFGIDKGWCDLHESFHLENGNSRLGAGGCESDGLDFLCLKHIVQN